MFLALIEDYDLFLFPSPKFSLAAISFCCSLAFEMFYIITLRYT